MQLRDNLFLGVTAPHPHLPLSYSKETENALGLGGAPLLEEEVAPCIPGATASCKVTGTGFPGRFWQDPCLSPERKSNNCSQAMLMSRLFSGLLTIFELVCLSIVST